jgi:hypothetical protein
MESVSSPTDVVFQGCPFSLSTNETPENAGGYGRTDNPRNMWRHFDVLQNLFRLSQSSQSESEQIFSRVRCGSILKPDVLTVIGSPISHVG